MPAAPHGRSWPLRRPDRPTEPPGRRGRPSLRPRAPPGTGSPARSRCRPACRRAPATSRGSRPVGPVARRPTGSPRPRPEHPWRRSPGSFSHPPVRHEAPRPRCPPPPSAAAGRCSPRRTSRPWFRRAHRPHRYVGRVLLVAAAGPEGGLGVGWTTCCGRGSGFAVDQTVVTSRSVSREIGLRIECSCCVSLLITVPLMDCRPATVPAWRGPDRRCDSRSSLRARRYIPSGWWRRHRRGGVRSG